MYETKWKMDEQFLVSQRMPWLKILSSSGPELFSMVSRTLQNDFLEQKEAYIP